MQHNPQDIYKVTELPSIEVDRMAVEKFTVPRERHYRCTVPPGEYTKLIVDGALWMSDTPDEIRDHRKLFSAVEEFYKEQGSVTILLHGLGLGMALKGCVLESYGHARITVVEKDPRVAKHIGDFWKNQYPKTIIKVINDDALTWKPQRGARWDVVWHDIWIDISSDNFDEMSKLHRRFGQRCKWQSSWSRDRTLHERRMQKRHEHRYGFFFGQ